MRKVILSIIGLICTLLAYPQGLQNYGTNIVVTNGGFVYVNGDYRNSTLVTDGSIDLNGTMIVRGNFINNAANGVFVNVEPIPNGIVNMNGTNPQAIAGTGVTGFENLELHNSDKTLTANFTEVNGIMTLDAVLNLNSNRITMNSNNPNAINYVSKYILSETLPAAGYGEVRWNIGSNLGTYNVPFGNGFGANNLNVTLSTLTPGNPATGSITFATYPTVPSNGPLPTGVLSLNDLLSLNTADRFWMVKPQYNTNPNIDLALTYTDIDIQLNSGIIEYLLKGARWNPAVNSWSDIDLMGTCDIFNKRVIMPNISGNDFHSFWTLSTPVIIPDIYIPNAFTPNIDGRNDVFKPVSLGFEPSSYYMVIYDRWGEELFQSLDMTKGWDGTIRTTGIPATLGVYVWLIKAKTITGKEYMFNGHVTLVR